jgi:hypothetical protein
MKNVVAMVRAILPRTPEGNMSVRSIAMTTVALFVAIYIYDKVKGSLP